jgi:hypothetical protein
VLDLSSYRMLLIFLNVFSLSLAMANCIVCTLMFNCQGFIGANCIQSGYKFFEIKEYIELLIVVSHCATISNTVPQCSHIR